MSHVIIFIMVLVFIALFLSPFILFLICILAMLKYGNKFDKMAFITNINSQEILERMNGHNIKDTIIYEFIQNNLMPDYIFRTKEINKDWYYKEGSVTYGFNMKTVTNGTEIFIYVMERSSPNAQLRYGKVMTEFMLKKLNAKRL